MYDYEKTDANQPCELKGTGCSRRIQYDAKGNPHSFTYDSAGAQTQLIDPLNRRTTSPYDAAGQQNLRIDAGSNRTSFVFHTVWQLTSRKYPDGTRATFSYDTIGHRTLMADSTGR